MYHRKHFTIVFLACLVGLVAGRAGAQQAFVSLDHVTGVSVYDSTQIPVGKPITFYIRVDNETGHDGMCPANGFRLYSPDGATWQPHLIIDTTYFQFPVPGTSIDTTYYGAWYDSPDVNFEWHSSTTGDTVIFDGGLFVVPLSGAGWGTGADTVGFTGYFQTIGTGMWDGFNEIAWTISIDSFPQSEIGKSFCIDSSYFPPSGKWLWADGISLEPEWDGPHCFQIVDCCLGVRGNVNGDLNEEINLPDLTTYVSWAYKHGPEPPCLNEVDVNGDGSIDTADLGYLVSYMFKHGPQPPACP